MLVELISLGESSPLHVVLESVARPCSAVSSA